MNGRARIQQAWLLNKILCDLQKKKEHREELWLRPPPQ